jgi:chaperonin GroES
MVNCSLIYFWLLGNRLSDSANTNYLLRRSIVAIKPIGDRVLIESLDEEAEKIGSIYVPDTAKEKPQQGKIIATGEGKRDGKDLIPISVKAGDKVLYSKYGGSEIKYQGKSYLILSESDILAVID